MNLTSAQLVTFKADIAANTNTPGGTSAYASTPINVIPNTADGNQAIADWYNANASPDWWVWRTAVFESEYTRATSEQGTTWSWPAYIARSIQEQNAWARLFMGGTSGANPALANVRQGVADIFSGSANSAPAQRTHLLNMSMRRATRAEKLFSSGTGSPATPANLALNSAGTAATLVYAEGAVSGGQVEQARNS